MNRYGLLVLILGPSGSGKGTVIEFLHREFPDAVFPISCTTREPRQNERDHDVYHFISKEEFQRRIASKDFLEWAIVHHDHYYGTLKQPILDAIARGNLVIREVDMQGVASIKKILPRGQVISLFITAQSWDVLKRRILKRSSISEDELAHRKQSFDREMEFSKECDFVLINKEGESDGTCKKVADVIRSVRK